ncbi:MAG: dTDP-4-dehydrorhamnose reductase [Planctomycetes bacterium]|nr:dTDP-4-dehydrorhamnose reductase [Planctomycetota bacterium]
MVSQGESTYLIIGSGGMLGQELSRVCQQRGRPARLLLGPEEIDVTNRKAVGKAIEDVKPSVVLNATGYTDVDGAESDPVGADLVNRAGAENLALACRSVGALLVHYSTDYVFDGEALAPYLVQAPTAPQCVYGETKLAGEDAIRAIDVEHLIIRSSWLYAPHGKNFVGSILKLARRRSEISVVTDQIGRPTSCVDLVAMTLDLIDAGARGVFHAANDGFCSWHELAEFIVEKAGEDCIVKPCSTKEFPRPAKRPAYSVLDLEETIRLIGTPPHWKEAVSVCVKQLMSSP